MLLMGANSSFAQELPSIDRTRQVTSPQKKTQARPAPRTSTPTRRKPVQRKVVTPAPRSYFTISSQTADFGAEGGTRTFTISSSAPWSIHIGTDSWGHLMREGNTLTLTVDANEGTTSRSDYFTIESGGYRKRVDISQEGCVVAWSVGGSSRDYQDNAKALNYLTTHVEETKRCRLGAITENGQGVVIVGNNGYAYVSIPEGLKNKILEINSNKQKISSIALTNSGYYCIVYERNGWYGVVPEQMKNMLNQYNGNTEEITSVSISEDGNFAIVTDQHCYASHSSDKTSIEKAMSLYGHVKYVCVTNLGICIVCNNGIYYNNVPKKLEEKLQGLSFHPSRVVYTDSGTFLITSEEDDSVYTYYM